MKSVERKLKKNKINKERERLNNFVLNKRKKERKVSLKKEKEWTIPY